MNKHTAGDLAVLQALPLELKIRKTKQRIREWYDYWNGEVYVSFSGGKDSTVLKHIVDSMYKDVPSVFVNTGLEYPEIVRFVKSFSNVEIIRPDKNFKQVITQYGYPVISKDVSQAVYDAKTQARIHNISVRSTKMWNRSFNSESDYCIKYPSYCRSKYDYLFDAPFDISYKCCDVMKKKPCKRYEKDTGKVPILATMTYESRLRRTKWLKQGCNAFESNRPTSTPMAFWTEQDILTYLDTMYRTVVCMVILYQLIHRLLLTS